jgi:hypothetical protein
MVVQDYHIPCHQPQPTTQVVVDVEVDTEQLVEQVVPVVVEMEVIQFQDRQQEHREPQTLVEVEEVPVALLLVVVEILEVVVQE